jgi:2-isopropylmalate synthase
MSNFNKYKPMPKVPIVNRTWPDKEITSAPTWTSVDLRDGNQSLPIPMNPEKKLAYFKMLLEIGFKEIEVGFPSASQDDYDFVRKLIEENLIPDDVKISVLTQAREHLIAKTVESLKGVKKAIIHCYVATSDLHGRFVFNNEREEVEKMAIAGTQMVKDMVAAAGMTDIISYEFSPEEFTDSDLDFTIELCKKVKEVWGPAAKEDFILNLPATVERRSPNQYADMIEYFIQKYPYMDETSISLHAHNDQGCAVAATELALLAGANRVEGTIFGHGERTGNLDIMILAMNLFSRGIETGLDFSNLDHIVSVVEDCSGIDVHVRHPYAGQLVFTAFSGSHQDAIRKGMERSPEIQNFFEQGWKMPYLHIDPADVGRQYEKLIRINSQSGKGGIVYILEKEFGIYPPKVMHPEIGQIVQTYIDQKGGEIDSAELRKIFDDNFVNIVGPYAYSNYARDILEQHGDSIGVSFTWINGDVETKLKGVGNGPISAVYNALSQDKLLPEFSLEDFSERSLGNDADAKAIAFVGIRLKGEKRLIHGVGIHSNIDRAAIAALISALNRAVK